MASEQILAARRAQAIEKQARELVNINRKLSLIMAELKIQDTEISETPPVSQIPDAIKEEPPAPRKGKK
ncbi:MAG: hypothetical protein PHQ36_05820 [Anaerolineales bacterium]|nr:hypothetical protein [Anaerolineales bacterium]